MYLSSPDQQCSTDPTRVSLRAPPLVPHAMATVISIVVAEADTAIDNDFADNPPFLLSNINNQF